MILKKSVRSQTWTNLIQLLSNNAYGHDTLAKCDKQRDSIKMKML